MDYAKYIRKIELPPGYVAPKRLAYANLVAEAISRAHLSDDVRGINASMALIRRTRGGAWPAEPVSEEFNFVDLVWHELEFRDATSFTYALYDSDHIYLGCCYLYPMGRRTDLSGDLLDHDVDVSWWVTPDAYARGDYQTVYRALRHWLAADFPFHSPYFSNAELPPG